MSTEVTLLSLFDDLFIYILSYLNGKDLSRVERVCKRMTQNKIAEQAAHLQFEMHHPPLPPQLLEQHMKYTNMISTTFKYMWYITTKRIPRIQDVSRRYAQIRSKTDYSRSDHLHYMMEKTFCAGNIVIILNLLRLFKKYKVLDVVYFSKFFVKLGTQIGNDIYPNHDLYKAFKADDTDTKLRMNTILYLLKNHQDLLCLGEYYTAFVHLFMLECCDRGLVDLAVQFRRIGCPLKPKISDEIRWKYFFTKELESAYYIDYMWIDFKDPWPGHRDIDDALLQRKLDARIAVLKIGEIEEHEKLRELEIITGNEYYSQRQMVQFMKELLKVNGVAKSVKYKAKRWIQANICFV